MRVVHASPDAPEVGTVVEGGPTLLNNVDFRNYAGYGDIASGTTSIEVRVSEGGALALSLPHVQLAERTSFTILAVGLAGNGSLETVVS